MLPFANLSNDPQQEYFADGITEDLTTDIARIQGSQVLARNTAFTYKGKPFDAKQIGRELGVRYVLEGSVQRSGNKVGINVQLVDAETGAHLWAERFDRNISDLFTVQNEITARIARSLESQLAIAEARRPTDNPDALDYLLRGRAVLTRPITKENNDEAVKLFETALALDPKAVDAAAWLSVALTVRVTNELSTDPDADLQRAERLADRLWRHRRTARSRITQRAKCCVRSRGAGKPFPNSRERSRSIPAGCRLMPMSVGASF